MGRSRRHMGPRKVAEPQQCPVWKHQRPGTMSRPTGVSELLYKGPVVYVSALRPHDLCCRYSTLRLQHEIQQYVSECTGLCSDKTLFTDANGGPALACWPEFAWPCLGQSSNRTLVTMGIVYICPVQCSSQLLTLTTHRPRN